LRWIASFSAASTRRGHRPGTDREEELAANRQWVVALVVESGTLEHPIPPPFCSRGRSRNKCGLGSPRTLAKLAVVGGGGLEMRYIGRLPVSTIAALDEWVQGRLSGPRRSTSDREGTNRSSGHPTISLAVALRRVVAYGRIYSNEVTTRLKRVGSVTAPQVRNDCFGSPPSQTG
jgi:hypothetical protein